MKNVYLVRHAKSSWEKNDLPDFARPLNKRGKRDAPYMGKILAQKQIIPDILLSSPAKRARKTALSFADELNINSDNIKFDENIYEASSRELMEVIKNIDEKYKNVMLFGHNPGLTSLSNQLCEKYIDNIPTCGIVAIKIKSEWKNVAPATGEFLFFEYPKLYFK